MQFNCITLIFYRISPELICFFVEKFVKNLNKKIALAVLLYGFCGSIQANAQSKSSIRLIHTHKIGSNAGWDYLSTDHQHNRIYLSHGTHVNVLNETTGDSVGVINNTLGVHGIALVHALNKGYTSNGKAGTCTVFDMQTLKTIGTIKVGENPDAIFFDDWSKNVFVFNGHSMDVSIIDPAKDVVIATIPLGGKPETGISDGKGMIYVNIEDKNEVVCFTAKNAKIIKRFKLQGGEEPSGLAIDRLTSRLFVGCANKVLLVLDAISGKQISSLPIGDGSDGVVFDPATKLIYSANGEGTLSVIKEVTANKFELVQTVKTAAGARTLALDPISHHIFTPTADFKPGTAEGKKRPLVDGTFRVMELGN